MIIAVVRQSSTNISYKKLGMLKIDLKGLKCPLPALKTRKAISKASKGQSLYIEATDPMSVIDIPHAVQEMGAALIQQSCENNIYTFTINI